MSRFFLTLYSFFKKRQILLFTIFILSLIFFLYSASKISIVENVTQMLPNSKNSGELIRFMESSKFSDRIMFVVSSNDTSDDDQTKELITITDELTAKIEAELAGYVESVISKVEENDFNELTSIVRNHLPVFIDDKDYTLIDSLIRKNAVINKNTDNYRSLVTPSGAFTKKLIVSDPLGFNLLALRKFESFKGDENFVIIDKHFATADGKQLLFYLQPKYKSAATNENIEFVKKLNSLISQQELRYPGTAIHYFGAPVVAAGNSIQIRKDTTLTLTITIILLLIIFLLFFRKALAPVLIMIPVVFGGLFALCIIYYLKGSVSAISIGAGSLILGIAVNYSLHFLTHTKLHQSIEDTIRDLAYPMTAGSLTTIGGFLCLQFVDAPVLQDLGLFSALSLAGAAITTLIFLPHLISRKSFHSDVVVTDPLSSQKILEKLTPYRNKIALSFILITPFFLYFARDVTFESDMNKINYMSDSLKESEEVINNLTTYYRKSINTSSSGNDLEAALQENEKLLPVIEKMYAQNKIIDYSNVASIFPSEKEQQRRINKWKEYWKQDKVNSVYQTLDSSAISLGFKINAFKSFIDVTNHDYDILNSEASLFIKQNILNNYIDTGTDGVHVTGLVKTTNENAALVYNSLSISNNTIVIDRQRLTDELVDLVSTEFNFITLWTSVLVLIALFIIYGRIELTIISFTPMVLTWIWILGLMALFNLQFNIINIILSTLIFALGDDFCIFTTDSLQQRYARKTKTINSTTISISLSAIATMTGIGVLILAEHPALKSIALVSIIGICSVWLMSQIIQPFLFQLLIDNPTSVKHQPYTFWGILKSVFAFSYFVMGSLLITIIGIIILKLLPGNLKYRKYIYHIILSKFCGSMIYIMTNVKKKIINPLNEDFKKPAVIIANHASFLDILLTVMLHPKLILLTNSWVWNSPVFGIAIRMAEYYHVSDGAENTIKQLQSKVDDGYSIVVFPEGTRSVDGKIGRFHKGAFYLAEHLKIDILPILIHGAGHTMTKNFFYLKDGFLTLKMLPRIAFDDIQYGSTLRDRTKMISSYFKEQFNGFKAECETPGYFKKQIFNNYLYKGPVLEWYMKIKMKLENNYELFYNIIPGKGSVVDVGCGYGFLSYMLSLTSSSRKVTGIDYDQEKIIIAENGYLKGSNLNFINASAVEFNYDNADVFILNDVLHYLTTEEQHLLLDRCQSKLNPSGMIVVRDGMSDMKKRHLVTRLTEFMSIKITGFNKSSSSKLSYISEEMIQRFAKNNQLELTKLDTTKLTSNVIFILKKAG